MDARERLIERMGLLNEMDGLSRIAGRIFGLLLLTPGESSLEDLTTALGVSRASVSNETRRLMRLGLLERRSRPGDRREYYSLSPDAFRRSIEARIERLRRFHVLLDEARELGTADAEVAARLESWDEAHRLALTALEGMLAQLEGRRPG